MSLPKYPEYKDSGVSWLGEVPAHWEITKTKYVCSFTTGWTPPTGDASAYEGDNLWANISDLGEKIISDTAKRISNDAARRAGIAISPSGSLLFSFKLSIGQVSFAGRDMYTNEAIATFQSSAVLSAAYAYYAFPFFLIKNASENIYGAKLLNQELIRAAMVALPSIKEQSVIASFLDRETAKIDALIAEQEKLIALLAEKRQATISRAVTRGLDPNVPLKDSGVPWLGKVPMHWDIVALKRICDVRDGTHDTPNFIDPSEDTYPLITTKDLSEERVCFDEAKHISSADFLSIFRRSGVEFGDVIMPMIGSVGGAVFVDSQKKFAIKNIALFKKGEKFISEWLRLVLNSNVSNVQFDLLRSGGVQGFVGLGGLRNLIVPYPCRDEQIAIVNFLEEKLSEIDLLDAAARNATLLLTERRAALISAAVTGKIDVRGLAA